MRSLGLSQLLLPLLFIAFTPSAWGLRFEQACTPASQTLVLGAVGDFLMHAPLQKRGNQNGYQSLWKGVQHRINQVGLMYANLETPVAPGISRGGRTVRDPGPSFDNNVYSSYPMFNTPSALARALKNGGFDILSTANNHALDRGRIGVDFTIRELENLQIPFTGTRPSNSDGRFGTIIHQNGFTLGFLACTYDTNGFPDRASQVLECYREKGLVLEEIRELRARTDAVIITPHWGTEYRHVPDTRERAFARELLEAGATAVIGTHPHVIQPYEKYKTSDGREGFIAYSTGNFISAQPGVRRVGLMLFIGLSKSGGHLWVNGVRYSPTYMVSSWDGVYFLDNTEARSQYTGTINRVMRDPDGFLGSYDPLITNPECN